MRRLALKREQKLMPVQYTIDPERRLVITSATPPLTSLEVRQFCRALAADSRFSPTFNQLHEIHEGALLLMDYNDASSVKDIDPFSKTSVRAFVVHTEHDYGIARMYEQVHGGNIRVFRSMQEARECLGLSAA